MYTRLESFIVSIAFKAKPRFFLFLLNFIFNFFLNLFTILVGSSSEKLSEIQTSKSKFLTLEEIKIELRQFSKQLTLLAKNTN